MQSVVGTWEALQTAAPSVILTSVLRLSVPHFFKGNVKVIHATEKTAR